MVSYPMSWSLFSSSALLATLVSVVSSVNNTPTTCYVIDGTHNSNAGFRCNNQTTGHSSCCGIGGICYSNGVCQQSNGDVQDYLRVGCTDPTWQDPACLDQCSTFATDSSAGIRFCNGAITATTQYCCDNGTSGIGSFACCGTPSSIFAISPAATFLAQIALSYTSSSSSSSPASTSKTKTAASSTTITASPAAHTTSAPTASSGVAHDAIIGGAVGTAGVLAFACIGFLFWRRRRNARNKKTLEQEYDGARLHGFTEPSPAPKEMSGTTPLSHPGKQGYFGGRRNEPPHRELPSSEPRLVYEMATNTR